MTIQINQFVADGVYQLEVERTSISKLQLRERLENQQDAGDSQSEETIEGTT